MLQNIFVGVILTATSVSISVETLKELGKLSTKSGNAILGAALIDDVLGIIALTVITSFADSSVSIAMAGLKILGFFVFCILIALLFIKVVTPWLNRYKKDLRRFPVLAFAFCLLMAYASERFFGVSDITGAFVAGLILSNNRHTTYMQTRFDAISFMFLSPVFFASVGLKVTVSNMNGTIIMFMVLLTLVAILSKIIGCGLGAKMCRYTNLQAAKIGIGMVSRGEVALIVTNKGIATGMMNPIFLAPMVIMVFCAGDYHGGGDHHSDADLSEADLQISGRASGGAHCGERSGGTVRGTGLPGAHDPGGAAAARGYEGADPSVKKEVENCRKVLPLYRAHDILVNNENRAACPLDWRPC